MDSLLKDAACVEPLAVLSRFRRDFHACLTARPHLPSTSLPPAPLTPCIRVNTRWHPCAGRCRLLYRRPCLCAAAMSVLPPATSPRFSLYPPQMIPGWPYSVIAALEPGRTSWTAVLDAVRLGPDDDETEVTAAQVREVITRLIAAGHWHEGDLPVLVVFDAGYDVTRLAWLLADLPVELLGRLRSDRVMWLPAPPRRPGMNGRPRKHGRELALSHPEACPDPLIVTSTATSRYGTAAAAAWDRVHPRLTHRAAWLDHEGNLPVIEGTLIRLQVDYLPGDRDPKPVWLWWSRTGALPADVDRCWQSFLRRFDLEHTFRLFKQILGWTAPKIRDPAAADRWTWLIIACHAQLRLARPLAADLRRPWERPAPPGRLTPARVRRGFRNIRAKTAQPASAPKPGKPGPGRPPGSKNRHLAPRHDVGKTTKRELTLKTRRERAG